MNVVCIGYFDKFSRFFLNIEKHLKNSPDISVDLRTYSIHFSGFLYTLVRLKYSSWIAVKAWFLSYRKRKHYLDIISRSDTYKGLTYNQYIAFHKGLNKNINHNNLRFQALAYIDIFDKIFESRTPDYLLTIGDSRLCVEIAVAMAKLRGIKIYYIEQGPFNTTFFDNQGVNANLSIREKFKTITRFEEEQNSKIPLKTNFKKYKRSLVYRTMDMLLMTLFQKTNLYPPDLKYTDLNTYNIKVNKTVNFKTNKAVFLIILQIPSDVNMICHSPFFKSHYDIVKHVYLNLPSNVQLVIREHPLYINKYDCKLYDFIKENDIITDNSTSLNTIIDIAKVVIVNNSTVGIEALLRYKSVVVLGNAFYDHEAICLKLKEKEGLSRILENALSYSPNKKQIDSFFKLVTNTVLLKGTITDRNLNSSKHIATQLLTNF